MKFLKFTALAIIGLALVACSQLKNSSAIKAINPLKASNYRTVITTDGEVDDMNSMIRYLYYSNELDLSGIVLTSSTYHYAGDKEKGIEAYRWTGTDWINDMLNAYDEIQPNLRKHAKGYPKASELKKITKIGNIKNKGDMKEETEGSRFLEKLFLDNSNKPIYVQTWGGTNTTARALKSIEETYKDSKDWKNIQQKVYNKLVLYIILDQDETYKGYIAKNWPKLMVINDSSNFWHFAYAWQTHSEELNKTLHGDWQKENLLQNHGPLMDLYASMGDGKMINGELAEEQRGSKDYLVNNPNYKPYDFISEGDSPSYFYLFNNGLGDVAHPEYGGWGGRFSKKNKSLYQNTVLDYNPYSKQFEASYTLTRWIDDIENDFATRVDWGTASNYSDANHAPRIAIKNYDKNVKAGEKVTLTAKGTDPDKDKLTYNWWRYFEADSYQESSGKSKVKKVEADGLQLDLVRPLDDGDVVDPVELSGNHTKTVSFTIPKDAKSGDTFHIIAEVQDDGEHNLKAYKRIILTVD
ncbi:nucleoside hydrolase-like domain-containing protein [Streptococcus dentasini]